MQYVVAKRCHNYFTHKLVPAKTNQPQPCVHETLWDTTDGSIQKRSINVTLDLVQSTSASEQTSRTGHHRYVVSDPSNQPHQGGHAGGDHAQVQYPHAG